MISLNALCHAEPHLQAVCKRLLEEFPTPLIGCEMGVAYGGGIEALGKLWLGKGIVFGFDTFTGHPKHLASGEQNAADCMDSWYAQFGHVGIEEAAIRAALDEAGLRNVILVQGLIDENTSAEFLPPLHYALLDLDISASMRDGYRLVRDRIVPGGYLCLHDVVPVNHIPGLPEFYAEVLESGRWEVVQELPGCFLVVLKRK